MTSVQVEGSIIVEYNRCLVGLTERVESVNVAEYYS